MNYGIKSNEIGTIQREGVKTGILTETGGDGEERTEGKRKPFFLPTLPSSKTQLHNHEQGHIITCFDHCHKTLTAYYTFLFLHLGFEFWFSSMGMEFSRGRSEFIAD